MLKWHGNEEKTDTVVYYMLQSCGVHAVSYLKTKVIMKIILWPQHSGLDLKVGFPSPQMGLASMIKVHTAVMGEIRIARRFILMHFG